MTGASSWVVYLLVRAWWESILYSCLGASFLAAPFSSRLALLGWSGFPLLSFHVLMLWSRAAFLLLFGFGGYPIAVENSEVTTSKLQTVAGETNWQPNLKDCGAGVWFLRPVVSGKFLTCSSKNFLVSKPKDFASGLF